MAEQTERLRLVEQFPSVDQSLLSKCAELLYGEGVRGRQTRNLTGGRGRVERGTGDVAQVADVVVGQRRVVVIVDHFHSPHAIGGIRDQQFLANSARTPKRPERHILFGSGTRGSPVIGVSGYPRGIEVTDLMASSVR